MSFLTMIQQVTRRLGINEPNAVISSTDQQVKQLVALANEEGEELLSRYSWSVKQREATFTTVATASQGAITTIAGTGFDYIVNDTIWNRSTTLPIMGPVSQKDWQTLQAFPVTGPYQQYRIQNGLLYIDPVPTAGDSCYFEYMSKAFCETSGGTDQTSWQADTDVGLLDERLMIQGIIWRWLSRKGLDYAEDFAKYEKRVADAMARDGGKRVLSMDGTNNDRIPGVFVPEGNWNL